MNKKIYFWFVGIAVAVGIFFIALPGAKISSYAILNNFQDEITIYKSQTCGCCDIYVGYFKKQGNSNVNVINSEDIDVIREKYNVPATLESCHTTIIGNYFVEGHMPLEAIDKLLDEKPDIAGISLPGMPSGAPGMTGTKKGDFVVYAVNHDRSYDEFMRL